MGKWRRGIATMLSAIEGRVGAAGLQWSELGFKYVQTNGCVRMDFKGGQWEKEKFEEDMTVRVHAAATALQYGQSCFEGLKAFATRDGGVNMFRPVENARRMARSTARLMMPSLPEEAFIEACRLAVRNNLEFVPPYGSGGALYLRPTLFGTTPRIGVAPSNDYTFVIVASPVGDYYKGALKPVSAKIADDYDRAAPNGLGNVKTAANYAADLLPSMANKALGFPVTLYLDAKEHRYIEEFGTSNFVGIKGDTYITPNSNSILESITNISVQDLAKDLGLKVECRKIPLEELSEFDEVAAVGTAVVLTPVSEVVHNMKHIQIGKDPYKAGPVLSQLYKKMRGIQTGELEDSHNWMVKAV